MTLHAEFGPTLRALRQALGLSQLALANRLGSTQRHLSFLETGRSRATPDFLARLCTDLDLSHAQRGALFEASGYRNPYPDRALSSAEVDAALDTIAHRILRHWPFPAFALDRDWTLLRANDGARRMFAGFGIDLDDGRPSLLTLVLSTEFRGAIRNWENASLGLYFRLQRASERDPHVREAFDAARRAGLFDHVPAQITGQGKMPVLSGVEMGLPGGQMLRMTPLIGQLATVQDVMIEGLEIEFMVPLDDATEAFLGALAPGAC